MPRPFGVWAPAQTIAEFKARCPRLGDYTLKTLGQARSEIYYSPEAMAHFKDPQTFKDAVNTLRAMRVSDKFFGEGLKMPRNPYIKLAGVFAVQFFLTWNAVNYYYTSYLPATNPSWRKVMNKEWDEAINNSPWDHRTHVWQYADVTAANIGNVLVAGQHKYYIPA